MKQYLIFGIFLFISQRTKTTAKEIAENFEISQRTVYRYIDLLCMAGMPIMTDKGKNGGIKLLPCFSLENFILSRKEKDTLKSAVSSKEIYSELKSILNKICV